MTLLTGMQIARDPALRPFVDRGAAGIEAATEQLMATHATPEALTEKLRLALHDDPRNWVVIDALLQVAEERALPLPVQLTDRSAALRAEDTSLLAMADSCARCAIDPAQCALSAELLCQAPMVLTSAGDVMGIGRAGWNYMTGTEVDQLDFALSAVGLTATAAVVASGGTTVSLKLGAGTVRIARRMRLLSPRLVGMMERSLRSGVDWAALPAARSTDDLSRLVRQAEVRPLAEVMQGVQRIGTALPPAQTLHLLRYVDDATDARRLANAAEALGPRTVGRLEVLGKARFLRATIRWSEVMWQLAAAVAGLLLSLAGVLAGLVQSASLRMLRRLA